MASRLPTPGSDEGNWGDILNDLRQAHTETGQIKAGAVTAVQLNPGAITTTAVAHGSITEAKLSQDVKDKLNALDSVTDGREVELRTNTTHLQWRYKGGTEGDWTNLVGLSEITGPQGATGEKGEKGERGPEGPEGTVPTWDTIADKPAYVAAGETAAAARTAIGAGTSNLAIGTTGTTAAAGDRQATETGTGMVELATTAETTTGTDTTRAVTPAAARAAGDARYVRTVNGTGPDSNGNVEALAALAAMEVEQVTLTEDLAYTLPADVTPNRTHSVVFTQDTAGGHTVTYGGASLTVDTAAGAQTEVELWPNGTSTRTVVYPGAAAPGGSSTITADDTPAAPAEGESASYLVTSAVVWPAGLVWSTDPDGGVAPTITGTALVSLFTVGGTTRAIMGATFPGVVVPDTTQPTVGSMTPSSVTTSGFTLTVSGASDETALHAAPYAFTTDGGTTWSAYQASPVYVATGKAAETGYSCNWRVRDAAGNVSTGTAQTVTTAAVVTTYFTDFSEYAAGAAPSGWSSVWDAPAVFSVVEDATATGGKGLRIQNTAPGRVAAVWSAIPYDESTELVARFKLASTPTVSGVAGLHPLRARVSGDGTSETGLTANYLLNNALAVSAASVKYAAGTPTESAYSALGFTAVAGTWYWVRAAFVGSTVSVRIWADGNAEPGTWQSQHTFTSPPTSGGAGLGGIAPADVIFDVFGAGIGGAAAPVSA